jgi:hypothetical protein
MLFPKEIGFGEKNCLKMYFQGVLSTKHVGSAASKAFKRVL